MILLKICVSVCVLLIIHAAQSTVVDYKTMTWNMQGSKNDGRDIWTEIKRLVTFSGFDVIVLQEAGPRTSLPQILTPEAINELNPDRVDLVATPLNAYQWNYNTKSRPQHAYIYFLKTDKSVSSKVNMAIVTKLPVDDVIILQRPGAHGTDRPILGVRFGTDYFFNIHANAGNSGGNAAGLIDRVHTYMQAQGSNSWMVLGDFNREPARLTASLIKDYPATAPVQTVHQSYSTQKSRGNIDYAVDHDTVSANHKAKMLDNSYQVLSDHIPIQFTKKRRSLV